jgi:hypothetical protein
MTEHDEAILAFHEGRVADALRLLEELLSAEETSELWNDWGAVQLGAGRISHEFVELAHAKPVRLTSHNLLASPWAVDPQQDPVWRLPRRTRAQHAVATPHDGAVGADVTRGT